MMKNYYTSIIIGLILGTICIMSTSCASGGENSDGPSMKVVVKDSTPAGRFIEETANSYVVEIQDSYELPKEGASVELWKAADGKGVVYLKEFGKVKAYGEPDSSSEVYGELIYEEGYVPDTYPCLGYSEGWFKIDLDGLTAYVPEKYVRWDAIDSF